MQRHLVSLNPIDKSIAGRRRLLKWEKPRAVPAPGRGPPAKQVFAGGMVCELDDADLDEARSFCDVEILASQGSPDDEAT